MQLVGFKIFVIAHISENVLCIQAPESHVYPKNVAASQQSLAGWMAIRIDKWSVGGDTGIQR